MLKPYEFTLYLLLLRATEFKGGEVRIGKRTISARLGKGTRASQGNYQHITEKLNGLADAGFIAVGDTSREGTQYRVLLPEAVPAVRGGDCYVGAAREGAGLFHRPGDADRADGARQVEVPVVRRAGDGSDSHARPHRPSVLGGPKTPENLTTACLTCNAIKSGPHI